MNISKIIFIKIKGDRDLWIEIEERGVTLNYQVNNLLKASIFLDEGDLKNIFDELKINGVLE